MIFDRLERAERYFGLNRNFANAFNYIRNNDLKRMEPGKYEIDGENSFLIIASDRHNPDFTNKLEAHKKYIDVQTAVEGSFGLTWKALEDCKKILSEYDPEKDAEFYSDEPDFELIMNPGTFAVMFPEDAHFPQPPAGEIKKAILKIKV